MCIYLSAVDDISCDATHVVLRGYSIRNAKWDVLKEPRNGNLKVKLYDSYRLFVPLM